MKDFCFPEGVKIAELKPTDSMSEALSILYGRSTNVRNENTFVFTLNGLAADGKRAGYGNKAGWLYCTCLKIPELIQTVTYSF